jgi:hypothetical protein
LAHSSVDSDLELIVERRKITPHDTKKVAGDVAANHFAGNLRDLLQRRPADARGA